MPDPHPEHPDRPERPAPMARHPVDLVALGFGLVFAALGLLYLADAADLVSWDGPTAVGGILVTVGVVVALVTLMRPDGNGAAADAEPDRAD